MNALANAKNVNDDAKWNMYQGEAKADAATEAATLQKVNWVSCLSGEPYPKKALVEPKPKKGESAKFPISLRHTPLVREAVGVKEHPTHTSLIFFIQ